MTVAESGTHNGTLGQRIWRSRKLYMFLLPTFLLLITFSYWPAISSLYHAFFRWKPFGESEWIGLQNFRQLYHNLFSPVPSLGEWTWRAVQLVGWGVSLLTGLVFLLGDLAQKRNIAWLQWVIGGTWWLALLTVLLSLGTGLSDLDYLQVDGMFGHYLFGHVMIAGLLATQLACWRSYRQKKRGLGWFGLSSALVIIFSLGLLIRFSMAPAGSYLRASCWNLARIMSFQLSVGLFMPLLIAEVLFHLKSEKHKYLYRVLFVIPMVVPGMVGLLMWQFIYDQEYGILNNLIRSFSNPAVQFGFAVGGAVFIAYLLSLGITDRRRRGKRPGLSAAGALALLALIAWVAISYATSGNGQSLSGFATQHLGIDKVWAWLDFKPQGWLSDGDIALYSIMLMGFPWLSTISMLIFYAGLQAIPTSVLESARLDGATGIKRFFTIDFPMILGQFKLLLILGIIGGIQGFQNVLILTYGGPGRATEMPGLWMFKEGYQYGRLGYGTTIGVAMFLLILVLTFINMKYIRPASEEAN